MTVITMSAGNKRGEDRDARCIAPDGCQEMLKPALSVNVLFGEPPPVMAALRKTMSQSALTGDIPA
jgi:hypothetical protein